MLIGGVCRDSGSLSLLNTLISLLINNNQGVFLDHVFYVVSDNHNIHMHAIMHTVSQTPN